MMLFITGCDSGMGYFIVERALEFGGIVVVTARDMANATIVSAAIAMHGIWQSGRNPG